MSDIAINILNKSETYLMETALAQRILGIGLGYEDLNDHQSLRDDPLLQIVTERG